MEKNKNVLHNPHPIRRLKYRFGLYKKRKSRRFGALIVFIILLSVLCTAFCAIEKRIAPIAFKTGETQLKNGLTSECNMILADVSGGGFNDADILT